MYFCCHSNSNDAWLVLIGQNFMLSSLHYQQPSFSQENVSKEMGKSINPSLMVPCFQLKDVDLEGWMNKLGGSGLTPKNWRKRWFVLKGGRLYYYKTAFVRLCFQSPCSAFPWQSGEVFIYIWGCGRMCLPWALWTWKVTKLSLLQR